MSNPFTDLSSLFPIFLLQSQSVISLIYDTDQTIIAHNPLFAEHLLFGKSAVGKQLNDFLMPESKGALTTLQADQDRQCKLLFKAIEKQPLPFECHIFCRKPQSLIIGEKLMLSNDAILQKMGSLNNEMVNLARELQQKNRDLKEANATIRTLTGILPICSFCKGIRDDKGYWARLEEFMSKETDVEFSHSVCPDCMKKHYPDLV